MRLFFDLAWQSTGCGLARLRVAGLGPAAAHCAELRSFRRGCIAVHNVQKELSMTERFFQRLAKPWPAVFR